MDPCTELARTSHWFCTQIVLWTTPVFWELLLLSLRAWSSHSSPAMKQGSSENGERKMKIQFQTQQVLPCPWRNPSQLVNSTLHQHKRVSGRHCLSGNHVYHSLLLSLETHLHFFPPTCIRVCEWKYFWGVTGWKNVNFNGKIRFHWWEMFNISWDWTLTKLIKWRGVFISISLFFFFKIFFSLKGISIIFWLGSLL